MTEPSLRGCHSSLTASSAALRNRRRCRLVKQRGFAARNGLLSRTSSLTASGLTWCAEPRPGTRSGTGDKRGCRGSRERYYPSAPRRATRDSSHIWSPQVPYSFGYSKHGVTRKDATSFPSSL
ncbi:hypothetical protein NDU88_008200 [Pleurodeles waltl]|uniref:Uncharacterized protein n=1 Tax=Pleurodeles waltl TaxID=8319 RepID=A0AAV7RVE3_PLEWA|nr:hypothetical protein NDU88_008200 [Pleurodeles waltl]